MAGVLAKRLGKKGRSERDQLEKEGLIEMNPLVKPKRGSQAEVTEKGWAWAQQHLDAEVSRSNLAAEPLEAVLRNLKRFMETRGLALSEIMQPPEPQPLEGDLESRIREAYFKLSSGRSGVRVRLCEIRNSLPEISAAGLNAALLNMQVKGKLFLYSLDDLQEITPEDHQAAIDISGFKKHVVYMRG